MRRNKLAPEDTSDAVVDLSSINTALTQISRSLAVLALRLSPHRPKTDTEQIYYLHGLGFERHEISAILGTTPGTVSVRLSEKKSQAKRRSGQRVKNRSKATRKTTRKTRR
jgi:DNA-directed RNA polymerase specialized sigma24 family protein